MASFWDQIPPSATGGYGAGLGLDQGSGPLLSRTGPTQDFNLGGFQQAPSVPDVGEVGGIAGNRFGGVNDPRLSTLPQPYQQGPGQIGIDIPMGRDNVSYQDLFPGQTPPPSNGPLPDWMQKDPNKQPQIGDPRYGVGGMGYEGGWGGTSNQTGQVQFGNLAQMGPQDQAMQRLQQIIAQHPNDPFVNILRGLNSPQGQQFLQSRKQTATAPGMAQAGQVAGQIGQWMQGGSFTPPAPQMMGDVVGSGPIQQQMNQNGGFYAPPAITGNPQQPMNPSQQSQQVQMQAPDGTMQYVNQAHVPHYQGLGAQVVNGSSYGGG